MRKQTDKQCEIWPNAQMCVGALHVTEAQLNMFNLKRFQEQLELYFV